jgi:HEPN domain-containing protein
MKRKAKDEGKRWLEQAEADLQGCKILLENKVYHLACFVAQQVAEKAVKAYLYAVGEELVTGHSVTALCTWAQDYDKDFASLKEEIAILDGYYIPTRYPNGIPDSIPAKVYTKKPAEEAVKLAERAIKFVKERI